jgi:tetratricopeptide (TPR) repeat protein
MYRTKRTTLLLALLLITAVALGADNPGKIPVTTSSKEAMDYFVAGRTMVDNLRLTDAIASFKKAADKDSSFALAYLYLATTAPTAKEFFGYLDKATELAKSASAGEQLWITGFRQGALADPAAQRESFQKLVDMFPNDERAQTLLGTNYLAQQDYTQALQHLKRATEISPAFAPAYNQLGYTYRFLEKYKEAQDAFKKYIELIPNDPNPYDSYAELLLKLGQFDESIEQYEKALSINDHFANSFTGIAAALMYEGKHDEARAELQKAYSAARNDGEKRVAIFGKVITYVDEGNPEMALQEMNNEFSLAEKINDPGNMSADQTAIGNILLEMGKADDALAAFEKSATLIWKSSLAKEVKENADLVHHYNLGRVALLKKDFATASKEASQFLAGTETKDNKFQIRLAHELAGAIALAQQEYAQAVRELHQANQQNPYNLYRLALAYQATGMKDEARKYAEAATKFYGLPLLNYAFIREKAKRLQSAI